MPSSYQYNLVQQEGRRSLSVFLNGQSLVADEGHPNIDRLVDAVTCDASDEEIQQLFDIRTHLSNQFEAVSERVVIRNNHLYFDGQPINNTIAQTVMRFYRRGENFRPLVHFFEKVMTNLDSHVRDQLYDWISDRNLTISSDGDLIAYKGVRRDSENGYCSISRGPAIVDGRDVNGPVPNNPGSTVEIARNAVDTRSDVGCSTGLHVGTWDYASGFGNGVVLTTKVNPRDVVSVPTDCSAQKMRVCRYHVLDVTEQELTVPLYNLSVDEDINWGDHGPSCGCETCEDDYYLNNQCSCCNNDIVVEEEDDLCDCPECRLDREEREQEARQDLPPESDLFSPITQPETDQRAAQTLDTPILCCRCKNATRHESCEVCGLRANDERFTPYRTMTDLLGRSIEELHLTSCPPSVIRTLLDSGFNRIGQLVGLKFSQLREYGLAMPQISRLLTSLDEHYRINSVVLPGGDQILVLT